MSMQDDRQNDLPNCTCFNFENEEYSKGRMYAAANLGHQMIAAFDHLVASSEFCDKSLPYLMDMVVICLAVRLGTLGTAIEDGTQEAQWETERVLTGLEARVLARVRWMYDFGRKHGLTAEKVRAMRDGNGETIQ